MAKKIIQDIIVKRKPALIRQKPRQEPVEQQSKKEPKKEAEIFSVKPSSFKKKRKRTTGHKMFFWPLMATAVSVLAIILISSFTSALIKIIPKQEFVEVDTNFRAVLTAQGDSGQESGVLSFETMQSDYKDSYEAKSTEVKKVSKKASGQIVIYNAYSSVAQTLIAKTRFETSEGKIYRIKNRITVPGAKIKDGKVIPNSIEVTVYADESGEAYNIGLTDFAIPGFKGDPRYEKFYARSKTEMSGGVDGVVPVISKNDITDAENTLRAKVRDYLIQTVSKQKPEEFLLYDGAMVIDFSEPEENPKAGDVAENFKYELGGTGTGFLLKKSELERELVKRYLPNNDLGDVYVANIEDLEFVLTKRDDENTETIFNLKGKAHFVWSVDETALREDLKGAKEKDYDSIFRKYPTIEDANVFLRPSWWVKIPKNPSRIRFEQVLK